jgi:outer membrane protein assembly factor BamB
VDDVNLVDRQTEQVRRLVAILAPLSFVIVAACSSASTPPPLSTTRVPVHGSSRAATSFTPWTTYHHDAHRSGHVSHPAGTPLHHAWSRAIGQVYGEPLVVGSTLVAATEGNNVVGLNAGTGRVRWKVNLGRPQPLSGLPCGNIDPLGITGTPAYDTRTGSVFAVAETVGGHHTLWALDAATGHKRWHRSLDVLRSRDRSAEQERAAVLVTHGRVLVSFGGLAGDCDNYVGYVTSTPTTGQGRTFHYAVPSPREAGMWATPGPVLGRNGHVYVSVGNGAQVSGKFDRSDSVTELSPVRLHRLALFAPSTWRQDNQSDLDLGSSSPTMIPALKRVLIAGKRGVVYLLHESLGGIGGQIRTVSGCGAFGGTAVVGRTVLMPCLFQNQVRALRVGASSLHWAWSASGYGSPVVAGTRVYVADRNSGDLLVLRLRNGSVIQRIHAGNLTHFPSEVVDGGFVFVPTSAGISAFHG